MAVSRVKGGSSGRSVPRDDELAEAGRALERDPAMVAAIARVGVRDPYAWAGMTAAGTGLFAGLVLHIVGQQISVPAALSVFDRLRASVGGDLDAGRLAGRELGELRAVGLSTAKANAIRCLAVHVATGELDLEGLRSLQDPDVLPAGDIGIREAVRRLDGSVDRPSEREVLRRGEAWRP